MIDLHSHILPNMDDGSDSVQTSLEMLRRMSDQGVTTVCATSHYYADENSIDTFCARREKALCRLEKAAAVAEPLPKILPAAEVAYFPKISECESLECLRIEDTRTLMLEMPFCDWNSFQIEEVTALALDRGLELVLVHPERFCFSKANRRWLEKLAELPLGLQINAGSLLRWRSRRLALELLELTNRPLLGSDCHNLTTRPPNLKEGRSVARKKLGENFLARMDETAERLTAPRFARA